MSNQQNQERELIGVIGEFTSPDALYHACEHARDSGIRKMDAYSPFPVHGIEEAIGFRRTRLPFIVLAVAIGAVAVGVGLQYWTNATETGGLWSGYQFKISGKPMFSLPANIPVAYEITILSSAFAAFFGMLALNRLPQLANPLLRIARFKRASNDRFFLAIENGEGGLGPDTAKSRLREWGASEVEEIWLDKTDHQLPAFFKTLAILGVVLLLIPPALVFRSHSVTRRDTRLHLNPDMDFQHRYAAQMLGPRKDDDGKEYFFANQRAAMASPAGTVSRKQRYIDAPDFNRGFREDDSGEQTGLTVPAANAASRSEPVAQQDQPAETPPEKDWLTEFPEGFDVSRDQVFHGQKMFNVYCAVCHGYTGGGDGLVNQRASALVVKGSAINGGTSWTTAKSLHDPAVVEQPVGKIFDTITNGRATMGPYGSRIQPEDRWAIVLYVKALQAIGTPPAPVETGGGAGDP
jgi:mono/diheme cytochrome c family protein